MSLPGDVSMLVDEDELINRIALDTHRTLFVTPSRIIVYREGSLLAETSVDTYGTAVERLKLVENKKHVTVTFEYRDDPPKELELPKSSMAKGLKALLASVIRATEVVDESESIGELFRFNELTIIVTNQRIIKHVGTSLWGDSHESINFEDIRDIRAEEGTISTEIIIETTDATERLKVPQDTADRFVELIDQSVCEYHDVADLGVLRGDPDAEEPDPEPDLDRLRPLKMSDDSDGTTLGTTAAQFSPSGDDELAEMVAELADTIERQQELLVATQETLERIESSLNRDQ